MNFTLESDQPVEVNVHMEFIDMNVFQFKIRMAGRGPAQYCITGRSPQELVRMELEYNDMRYAHPIEAVGNDLKTISIYGGRDRWSQLLRDTALASG